MTREQRLDAAKAIIADAWIRSRAHHKSNIKDNQNSYDEGFADGQIDAAEKLMPFLAEPASAETYLVGGFIGVGLAILVALFAYWIGSVQ